MQKPIIATCSFHYEYYRMNQGLVLFHILQPAPSWIKSWGSIPQHAMFLLHLSRRPKTCFLQVSSFSKKDIFNLICNEQNITALQNISKIFVSDWLSDSRTPIFNKSFLYEIFTLPEIAEITTEIKDLERKKNAPSTLYPSCLSMEVLHVDWTFVPFLLLGFRGSQISSPMRLDQGLSGFKCSEGKLSWANWSTAAVLRLVILRAHQTLEILLSNILDYCDLVSLKLDTWSITILLSDTL